MISRRVRAILPIALTWGVGWGVFTFLLTTYNSWRLTRLGYHSGSFGDHLFSALVGFIFGTVGGLVFAVMLARAERGGEVGKISYLRAALWGALTGLCFVPVLLAIRSLAFHLAPAGEFFWRVSMKFGGFGAVSSVLMLAIARKGGTAPHDPAQLAADGGLNDFVAEAATVRDRDLSSR
ncbi:MAG: hypothetical protein ABIS00_15450 [Gemmatimonadales bacterium]